MADERTYTALEHVAILETEVARQTADLRVVREELETEKSALAKNVSDLEAEKAELLTRLDKVEAEKSAAETAKVEAEKELADHKAEVERKAEVAALKTERIERAKTELAGIDEKYFTEERAARWAEMSAEQFDSTLADLKETAGAASKKKVESEDEGTEKAARETAAFRGGAEPTSTGHSTFMQLIAARKAG